MIGRHPRLILLSIILVVLFAVSALQGWITSQGEATQGITEVAIVKSDSPTVSDDEVEAMVRQAVALAGGLEGIIEPGDTVVIKPNLVWDARPEFGHVTDPSVTRAVVRLAQEAGAGQVLIAEGSAVYVSGQHDRFPTKAAFHVSGHDGNHDMVDDVTGVPLVDLNISGDDTDAKDPDYVTSVTLPNGLIRNQYWIPNPILNADVLIGVPVLKNHFLSGLTLALKNMIGIAPNDIYHGPGIPVLKSQLSHSAQDLPRHIVDLNLCRPMDFVVVDGLRGMTDGPNGNNLADPPMKLVMAGRDSVAVDTIGALVIGYDPASISYLPLAQQAGLGTMDVSHIRVLGRPVAEVRQDFPVPYGDPSVERAEGEWPTVQITYPAEGETVSGVVNVQAIASDNTGLARVEFYLDDAYLGLAADAPYQLALDTTQYSDGPHTLKAIVYDQALNQAVYTHTINITGGLTPVPTLTLTPTPPTRWMGWVEYNTTQPGGSGLSVLRVSVDGLWGLPVTVTTDGWSTTNWTGTKPEYGPFFCEFAPMPAGTLTVIPHGLGVSVRVSMRGPGVAVVRFVEQPAGPTLTPTASSTAIPTPTVGPTIEPTLTATPSPTPETAWMGWVEYNTTQPGGSGLGVLRVSVDGLWGLPVTVTTDGWSTTNWTGTKPEYGPFFCEFAPMPMGTLTVIPHGLGVSVRVLMRGPGVAVVRFARRPMPTPTATPTVLPSPTQPTPTATSTATGTSQPTLPPTVTATPIGTPTPTSPPQPTLPPTATFTPTGTPTATAAPTPTPEERWVGQVTSNTTYPGASGPVVLRVSVDGLWGLPVTVTANGWSTTNWTGTKPEYGPFFCEFAPMPVGTLTVIPHGLGVSVRVSMRGAGVAVVEFWSE